MADICRTHSDFQLKDEFRFNISTIQLNIVPLLNQILRSAHHSLFLVETFYL